MKRFFFIACGLFFGYGGSAQSTNDSGVTAVTSPASPVLPSISQAVSVTVKNFGTAPLTSATLGFSVNGVVQPNFPWTGNVAANATSASVQIGSYSFPAGIHTVKAWSKLPNGANDANAANDSTSITIVACNTLSGNYTINKNLPASATNYTTFSSACLALQSCGVGGPVTFTVAPNSGPYNEQIVLGVIPGTSAANTITFNGNKNTVLASPGSIHQGILTLDGADYVKFNELVLTLNASATLGWGIQLKNRSDFDIISNCNVNLPISSKHSGVNGIIAGESIYNDGNFANNLLLQNNTINGGFYGILLNGTATGTTTGNQIIGNKVRDPYSYGIGLNWGGTGTIIEGNDISCPTRTNGGIGGEKLYGISLAGTTTNTIVSKNRFHNTQDMAVNPAVTVYGIYTTAIATPGNENIIKNNLIYNINNNGGIFYGFHNSGADGTYYYHNSVSTEPSVTFTTLRGLNFLTAAINVKFINNIINLPSTATYKHAIYITNFSTALISNNNDLFLGGTGNIGYLNTNQATMANWNTNGYDQNSISADPVFVNPANNLRPMAAGLNNGGQPLVAVTDDFNGITRSTTTPDMGAYEFTPATNDAGIIAIVAPTSPITPGSQPVQVTLKNFGTAALTSATIGWSVNGASQPTFNWIGSLTTFQATAAPFTIGNYTFPAGNFTLKVWSQNPNGAADGIATNDTTILNIVSCAPLAGNYTINKNNPVSATNFQSISAAAARVSSCGVSAPVTFTVAAGTGPYNEQVEVGNILNSSATNTVTFEGSGNTVSVTPVGKPGIFVLNGANHVKLNNFVILLPASATTGWGVQLLNAADNNTISNNTINLPLTSTSAFVNGIISGAALNVSGNNTSNTKIQNNTINGGNYGIQLNGNAGALNATGNQITGNQLKDQLSYGISVSNTNGTLIEGNDISRPSLLLNGVGLICINLSGASRNTIVSKNRIHNMYGTTTTGMSSVYGVYSNASAPVGNENIVKNNLIYDINKSGTSFYGFYNSNSNGIYYYYNTVALDLNYSYNNMRGMYFTGASSNVKFVNNILRLPSNAANKHVIYLGDPAIALESNNNDLYVGASGNIGYYVTDRTSLANWNAVNSNAYDQNSVSVDPLFVSPSTGNFKPTSVAADNLGQPIASVTEDLMGLARHATTPDFGAYEFVPVNNDVSIIAVQGPATSGCSFSATDSVTVTIKNLGTSTQTSIPVSYSVNGVAIAVPETYTGSLAPNATATYTFNTKINLATPGNYEIIAKTLLNGDINTGNDADTINVTNALVTGMPVNLNFETSTTGISRFRKVDKLNSNITESAAASFGATSTKGMILDGVDNPGWLAPTGIVDPWTNNDSNFAAAYFCISPAGGLATDSLIMTFDLKQLFKTANTSTNFRITVNGTQVGLTYRPPFSGSPIVWQKVKVDLSQYKNDSTVQIGLESSVKEAYDNGNGTANLLDNIEIKRVAGPTAPSGLNDNALQSKVLVFPNPSTGIFNIDLPKAKTYELTVTDLTGKVLMKQVAKGGSNQLNLEGTAQGIYLLKVSGDNGIAVRKLIVE